MEYWASFAVINLAIIIAMYFIQDIDIHIDNKKNYICYFLGVILLILIYEFIPAVFRVVLNTFVYIFSAKYLFNTNNKHSVVLGISVTILNIISEIIYAVVVMPLLIKNEIVVSDKMIVFLNNFFIAIILSVISYLVGRKKIYLYIQKSVQKISEKHIVIFSLLIVIIFNFFGWILHFVSLDVVNNYSLFLISSSLSIFSSILVFTYLRTNNKYVDIYEKYNLSLENIRDYENIIENNRVSSHEIRNQFLMLRNMSKNKKMTNYIDSILNNSLSDSEELLNDLIRIPSGGLRGLIYTKLLSMKENNINYELYVDKKINVRRINKIDSDFMVDICKIVGVFLDNAIEAVQELDEKNITIELYAEKKDIVISITNNFSGFIDIENLEQSGYTTKSNGHGYGLKLVKDILDKNDKLVNYRELYENNFTQNLKIKM